MKYISNLFTSLKLTSLTAAACCALFTVCAWSYGPFKTPATAYIKSGDRVVLNQEISARTGSKIYIQFGQTMPSAEVEQAKPYCYFHLYRNPSVIDTEASLIAGEFEIVKTINFYDFGSLHGAPLQLASKALRPALRGWITQDASERIIITRLKLKSADQPEVIELSCGIWAVLNERNHLSIDEIHSALGDVVTLELGLELE
ncbi:MAG: hypothetical protein WBM41_04690 [Arenicellales bacterium]